MSGENNPGKYGNEQGDKEPDQHLPVLFLLRWSSVIFHIDSSVNFLLERDG
jgi:hypothetical protein